MRVHVYVVDTSTEWMAAAAMERTAFEVSKSHAKALGMSPLDVADAAELDEREAKYLMRQL